MITFFTTAKPFVGAARIRQLNAIRSWKRIDPHGEVLLFGEGEGYADVSRLLNLTHVPSVALSTGGMPLVNDMFAAAQRRSRQPFCAYLNADIMATESLLTTVKRIDRPSFVMVARRWDLEVRDEIDIASATWEADLQSRLSVHGTLMGGDAIDLFLWRGTPWHDLPPMVVGRGRYDNWLIYYCRLHGVPVVDATGAALIVHQSHDYSHVSGGRRQVMEGEEANANLELGGGQRHLFKITDADWAIGARGLEPGACGGDSARCVEVYSILHPDRAAGTTTLGRCMLRAWWELRIRWTMARQGRFLPLLKFPVWVIASALGRRA